MRDLCVLDAPLSRGMTNQSHSRISLRSCGLQRLRDRFGRQSCLNRAEPFFRGSHRDLKNQLANTHSCSQSNWKIAVIDNLESYRPIVTRMDGWRRYVDSESQSRKRA